MFSFLENHVAVYFVGIGGVSMSALALLLHDSGFRVRGCDARESRFTRMLGAKGIPVTIGEEEIPEETIVYTEAADRILEGTLLSRPAAELAAACSCFGAAGCAFAVV